jgi:hypothetical protein
MQPRRHPEFIGESPNRRRFNWSGPERTKHRQAPHGVTTWWRLPAAVAIIDEAELPRFVQLRFTIGY